MGDQLPDFPVVKANKKGGWILVLVCIQTEWQLHKKLKGECWKSDTKH